MGLTKVTAVISNLAKSKQPYEALFLVDTGAIDCIAPKSELLKAGITAEGKEVYELANGQPFEAEIGFARISLMGDEKIVQFILGPDNTEPIIGVLALESFGIGVDPITKTLRKMAAKPLKEKVKRKKRA